MPPRWAEFVLPGAYVEIERFRTVASREGKNHRQDAGLYNYPVQSFILRLGSYVDLGNWGRGSVLLPTISFGYQFNLFGPRIPKHAFKKTEILYVHDIYRGDIERQQERRERRK